MASAQNVLSPLENIYSRIIGEQTNVLKPKVLKVTREDVLKKSRRDLKVKINTNTSEVSTGEYFKLFINFSNQVAGFELDDLILDGGIADQIKKMSPTSYMIRILPDETTNKIYIQLEAESVQDNDGNTNSEASNEVTVRLKGLKRQTSEEVAGLRTDKKNMVLSLLDKLFGATNGESATTTQGQVVNPGSLEKKQSNTFKDGTLSQILNSIMGGLRGLGGGESSGQSPGGQSGSGAGNSGASGAVGGVNTGGNRETSANGGSDGKFSPDKGSREVTKATSGSAGVETSGGDAVDNFRNKNKIFATCTAPSSGPVVESRDCKFTQNGKEILYEDTIPKEEKVTSGAPVVEDVRQGETKEPAREGGTVESNVPKYICFENKCTENNSEYTQIKMTSPPDRNGDIREEYFLCSMRSKKSSQLCVDLHHKGQSSVKEKWLVPREVFIEIKKGFIVTDNVVPVSGKPGEFKPDQSKPKIEYGPDTKNTHITQ